MGGDDLGSDDDYLSAQIREDNSEENEPAQDQALQQQSDSKKRKRDRGSDHEDTNDTKIAKEQQQEEGESKEHKALLETSQKLLELDTMEQAAFLSAALSHYTRMSVEANTQELPPLPSIKRLSKFLVQAPPSTSNKFVERLTAVCNKKRLKKHSNRNGSPSIVIVCQSARRAVHLLKDCASLKTKAIKLFPKQGTVEEQSTALRQDSFGLAVGTPHRLDALMSTTNKSLSLQNTQLVVIDAGLSNKHYTVCTLPDTAQDCMKWIQSHVLPELQKRKDFKIAFC